MLRFGLALFQRFSDDIRLFVIESIQLLVSVFVALALLVLIHRWVKSIHSDGLLGSKPSRTCLTAFSSICILFGVALLVVGAILTGLIASKVLFIDPVTDARFVVCFVFAPLFLSQTVVLKTAGEQQSQVFAIWIQLSGGCVWRCVSLVLHFGLFCCSSSVQRIESDQIVALHVVHQRGNAGLHFDATCRGHVQHVCFRFLRCGGPIFSHADSR